MEHQVRFAKEFATLVQLLDERIDIAAQKAALRRCLASLHGGPAALSADGDILFVDRSIVPADAETTALALRISSQSIAAIAFEAGAAPSDVLATARWLVASAESTPLIAGMKTVRVDPIAEAGRSRPTPPEAGSVAAPEATTPAAPRRKSAFAKTVDAITAPRRKSTALKVDTPTSPRRKSGMVPVVDTPTSPRRKSGMVPVVDTPTSPRRKSGRVPAIDAPASARRSGSHPRVGGSMPRRKSGISGTYPIIGGGARGSGAATGEPDQLPRTRATELLELLDRAGGSPEVTRTIDDLVIATEQAARDDDLELLAEAMIGLVTRQGDPRGGALTSQCAAALQRLITPASLRLLAQAGARTRARTEGIQGVLVHAGEAGAAALITQLTLARSLADRRRFFEMLLKLPLAVPVLMKMLASPRWHVARNAADLLGQLHATESEAALGNALLHADERVRRVAALALSRLGTPVAIDSLRRALGDASPLVRVQAAGGLARRKGAKAASTLTRALDKESDTEVQLAVIAALGRLATPDAVNRLITAAEPDGRLFKKKPVALRVAAVHALGDVRTPAARAVLQALATDKEREVREAVLRVAMQSPRAEAPERS